MYEIGELGSGKIIVVPEGFVSDGASIPAPINLIMPRWGRWRRAGVLHDYLYHLLRQGCPHREAPDRRTSDDEIFYEALQVAGVRRPIRWAMWQPVRAFGHGAATPKEPLK